MNVNKGTVYLPEFQDTTKFYRGERNFNPGNIEKTKDDWLGEIDGTDPRFMSFTHPIYGIRAIVKLLINYRKKYGLNTIYKLIARWAPPGENDTKAYAEAVAKEVCFGMNEELSEAQFSASLPALTKRIISVECTRCIYTKDAIIEGITMAQSGRRVIGVMFTEIETAPSTPENVLPAGPSGPARPYLGAKLVYASMKTVGGANGYELPDGSWVAKETFDKQYVSLDERDHGAPDVSECTISQLIRSEAELVPGNNIYIHVAMLRFGNPVVTTVEYPVEEAQRPAAKEMCHQQARDKIHTLLSQMLAWAIAGIE